MAGGCKKNNNIEELYILKSELPAAPLAYEGSVTLSNDQFTASVEDNWCHIEVSGNTVSIQVEANYNNKNRSTLLRIKPTAGGKDLVVPITQIGMLFDINTPIENLTFSLGGNDRMVSISRNIEYRVEVDDEWVKYTIDEDFLTLHVDPATAARTSMARIYYGDKTVEIPITQLYSLSFSELMGDCKISFINERSANEVMRTSLRANITPLVQNKTFLLTTEPVASMQNKPIKVEFELLPDGKLLLKSGQLQATGYVDNKYPTVKRLYMAYYDRVKNGFCPYTDTEYTGQAAPVGNETSYAFENEAGWFTTSLVGTNTYYAIHGMVINGHQDTNISTSSRISSAPPYLYMLDFKLIK